MRREQWLLSQLPVGMVEDDFFVRFVSIFQDVATTLLDGADNIDNLVDVTVAPGADGAVAGLVDRRRRDRRVAAARDCSGGSWPAPRRRWPGGAPRVGCAGSSS